MFSGIKFIPKEMLLSEKSHSDSDESGDKKIKRRDIRKRRQESSDDYSSLSEENERKGKLKRKQRKRSKEVKNKRKEKRSAEDVSDNDSERDLFHQNNEEIIRKELGLDWMLRSTDKMTENSREHDEKEETEEHEAVEEQRTHPRELNPYLKDNGSGYPDDSMISDISGKPSSSAVGDGGASWRLKALKRAKEQAAREGRKLDKVVEERWGSLGQLTASVVASRAAPSHAHLHAIRDRKKGPSEFPEPVPSDRTKRSIQQIHGEYNGISSQNSEMRRPKHDNLSWKKSRSYNMSAEDKSLISSAISDLNKFANDGSFMERISQRQNKYADVSTNDADPSPRANNQVEKRLQSSKDETYEEKSLQPQTPVLSANQLAAKVLQLRMKGKHEEAEKLAKEMEAMVENADADTKAVRLETHGSKDRYVMKQTSRKHKREDDADLHLAQTIMQNKKYSLGEEDEYGFDVAPSKKNNKKKKDVAEDRNFSKRLLTQQERCHFCFENPSRPKHLVVSIANFTYLMLPQRQPIVEGHCCILPMQHEAATRSVDRNVGDEIRNFKKCLVKMFASQDKDVLFLETVVGLSKQRRHCLLECIPIPSERAEEAPMYFRKALEEAEEEWGQHEMKKVIPTKGNLRQVIPENFSYFHVEFGLDKGFVHVIDKDSNFESGFGLNVVRGLLRLPEEDMYRSRRHESTDKQQQAVARFARDWQRFDWTRELE